jgi:benzoyl-CoA reductase/2-hydroxyglutaryl-CoA dehydratase subunit BcrC/BadD/HgdB
MIAELRRFARSLEKHFGTTITDDALRASIRLYNQRRRALAQFYAQRESFTAVEWFNVMNSTLLLPPDNPNLVAVLKQRENQPNVPSNGEKDRVRLALMGSTIDEPALLQILDEVDALVVADDFCNGARYFDTLVTEEGDPFEALADRELTRLACPCKHTSLNYREEHLLKMVQEHRVQGVIFYLKKFCDPHAWDYVPLAAALDRIGIPHLQLEVEQVPAVGQTRVRVEAFLEMIAGI